MGRSTRWQTSTSFGTEGLLRCDFGEKEDRLRQISWEEFFKKFDESNIQFHSSLNGSFAASKLPD
jgi:hypothetical protein